jgi:site-specific DNA-methyltransferase (adenine-specific)
MRELNKTGRANINFYNCDNMEFMKSKPDNYYSLAIVDPPYGDFGGIERTGGTWSKKYDRDNKIKRWDYKPDQKYFDELSRISKHQFIWGANYFAENLKNNRHFIIWKKHIPENFTLGMCEYMWSSMNENSKVFEWASNSQGKRVHPTQKPVALYKWLLSKYAKQGDNIFDSHGGSASIALACWDLGFDLDLCELDEDYFNDSWKRFENHTSQQQLF